MKKNQFSPDLSIMAIGKLFSPDLSIMDISIFKIIKKSSTIRFVDYGDLTMMGVGQLSLPDSRAVEHEPLLELTSSLEVFVFNASFQ